MTDNPFNNIIGLHCIESWCGYAGHLIMDLSTYPDKLSLLINNLEEAEWRFETVSAAWRLMSNQIFQTGSSENYEHNDKRLKLLSGTKVVKVQHNNKTDITIFFENGFQVDTFLQGEEFPPFELHGPIKETDEINVIQLTVHGEWISFENTGLTDEEKQVSEHSENTEKRWRNIVPVESFDNHCRNCAYFLKTSGQFYFWDYGICSNGKSLYDGKVVGIKSSCEHFSFDLEFEE